MTSLKHDSLFVARSRFAEFEAGRQRRFETVRWTVRAAPDVERHVVEGPDLRKAFAVGLYQMLGSEDLHNTLPFPIAAALPAPDISVLCSKYNDPV